MYALKLKCTATRSFWLLQHIFTGSLHVDENEEFLRKGSQPLLIIESKGHALHAFVNQKLQGYHLSS